jgi:hypothetical protein
MLGSKKRPQGTYDSDLLLKANYALGAGAATVFGLDGAGGAAIVVEVGTGKFQGCCIFDISAMVTAGNNEEYHLVVQGGDDNVFTNNVPLATLSLGSLAITGLSANDTTGRYKLYFDNERNGTYYPFIRLQITTVQAAANATFSAYVVPIQ